MTNENNDKLDDQQLSSLYRQTQSDLPPQHIDDRIIAAARHNSTQHSTGPFGYSWRVPASVAAILVISFGLVTIMQDELIVSDGLPAPTIEEDIAVAQAAPAITLDSQPVPGNRLKPKQKPMAAKNLPPDVSEQETIARKRVIEQHKKNNVSKQLTLESAPARLIARQPLTTPNTRIEHIRSLRLSGNIDAANQAADEFMKNNIGTNLDDIDIKQIKLTAEEWRAFIVELRILNRNSLAEKLEKIIPESSEN